jgi:hypothetical protein
MEEEEKQPSNRQPSSSYSHTELACLETLAVQEDFRDDKVRVLSGFIDLACSLFSINHPTRALAVMHWAIDSTLHLP